MKEALRLDTVDYADCERGRMMLLPRPALTARSKLLLRAIMAGVMSLGIRVRCTLRPVRIVWGVGLMCPRRVGLLRLGIEGWIPEFLRRWNDEERVGGLDSNYLGNGWRYHMGR